MIPSTLKQSSRSLNVFFIILIHCAVFVLIACLILPNMDIDMFENYAWGQTLAWGSFKHPPFFAWVTHIWFSIVPTYNSFYFLLSYMNAGVGLWGILSVTRLLLENVPGQNHHQMQFHTFLNLVLGFSILSLPFNLYAAVFNADSILLSLWPWTTYAFFSSMHAKSQSKKWFWTVLLGVFAAACLLGKYYSGVLLLTLLIISLSDPNYRRWYATPFPYVSLMLLLLFLLPHILWEYRMDFPFRQYYSHYLNVRMEKLLKNAFTFLLTGLYFFCLSWGAWAMLRSSPVNHSTSSTLRPISNRLMYCLCFLPALITIVMALIGEVNIKDRWAIPVWFALPILMANQLTDKLDAITLRLKVLKNFWFAFVILIGLMFSYTLWYSDYYLSRHQDYVEARVEMVSGIFERFQTRYPNQVLSWVGGDVWPDHTAPFAFYLPNHPRAVPGFPNQQPALVNLHSTWNQEYGALLCGKKFTDSKEVMQACVQRTRAWLASMHLPIREDHISYRAKGWRWSHLEAPKRKVIVFWLDAANQERG